MPSGIPTHFNFASDVLDHWARERPDGLALWCVNDRDSIEHKFTFVEMAHTSRRAAGFLNQAGITRGDRVLLITHRIPQWWMVMLGLIRLGAVPIPGTPLLTTKDIAYRITTAEVTALVVDPDAADKAGNLDVPIRIIIGDQR